ncbi:MAG: acyl-CoA dehydrogenase family protein [Fimbriimonadales bacterium]|nr:acyl-CoA dehydrogenase family protein [Fimbriimonadales bacterium]
MRYPKRAMEATARHTGAFLMRTPEAIFTPEQFDAESRQMADATERFVREQVMPYVKRLEHGEPAQMREILVDSAMLGLLGIDVPQEFGGLGLPKTTSALITEKTALQPSFAVAHAVHTSVGSLPLLLFGNEEQQRRYLPKLTSGEYIGAYALTEPEAGSDALAGRTRAKRKGDHYIITGNKIWITNAGFADLFVTFAKVDGERFTAFLVERAPGVLVEREERKLGLHGSSTCRVVFDRVEVPATNRLGEEGEGAYVALYTLNIGRFKIAAAAVGVAKEAWRLGYDYAVERKQFGRPIIDYPLVWRKLARNATMLFAVESALYRLADDLEHAFTANGTPPQAVWRKAAAHYAAECALLKVAATEMLHQVVDDSLQIHGGYGFSEEYAIAGLYRDTRVNRIYEGTNEINRLNLVDRLVYALRKGIWTPVEGHTDATDTPEATLATLRTLTGSALRAIEPHPEPPQAFVEPLAEALIALYLLESAYLRAQQTRNPAHQAMVALYHEQVRRQLAGWSADLAELTQMPPITVPTQPMAPLYEQVWSALRKVV